MVTYIYLVAQDIVLRCVGHVGCTSVSGEHFVWLLGSGLLEIMFELPMVIRIFKSKEKDRD